VQPSLLLLPRCCWPRSSTIRISLIAPPTDPAAIASAASSDTTRWGIAHLAIGVGYGLAVLAFLAIRSYLREAGEERWSSLALPFIVIGSTLLMEIGLLAAAEAGADVQAVQSALFPWFIPILLTGAITFGLGPSVSRWGSSAARF
jgi:hypothetical protein